MKNFIQTGDVIDVTAPYDLLSGGGALVGAMFGVATGTCASGANLSLQVAGVFSIAALTTDTASVGDAAYWDNTAKQVTNTATDNTKIGVFVEAKANGDTEAVVRLNGSF